MRTKILFFLFVIASGFFADCVMLHASTPVPVKIESRKNPKQLRILCYNLRGGRGMDGQNNHERVATLIKSVNADLVALQEVDSMTKRTPFDMMENLSFKTGMYQLFTGNIPYQGGKYGIGILSREKPLRTDYIPLPGTEEKRGVAVVEFKKFIFMSTHLSLTGADRVSSARIINDYIANTRKQAYIAGDFNDEDMNGPMFSEFLQEWEIISPDIFTFPADFPNKRIDFIMARKNRKNKVVKSGIPAVEGIDLGKTSDHLPLFIDIKN
jgi:endonuclease/exonuclease/phosphatase family metal-dependent hydrolase